MDFDEIFSQYYTLYRGEGEVPDTSDDEYIIGIRLANNAIRRWSNYDATYWKELFGISNDADSDATGTTVIGQTAYDAPGDMKESGGYINLIGVDGTTQSRIPLLDPQEAQFRGDNSKFAYFTGDPNNGFTLNLNTAPDADGLSIKYVYYKTPELITTGKDVPQMSNPDFIVQSMLADRFRASRNPYYTTAKRDAENLLGQMKMSNDSGNWTNPWSVPDRTGTVWGGGESNTWSF